MTYEELEAGYKEALTRYRDDPNVTGVDVGIKYVETAGGAEQKGLAVRLHVKEKLPMNVLANDRPGMVFQDVLGGVPTDVLTARPCCRGGTPGVYKRRLGAVGQQRTREDPPVRAVPYSEDDPPGAVQPGHSVSRTYGGAGTLGLIAYDRAEGPDKGRRVLLSCWHVLSSPHTKYYQNLRIVQPAVLDDPHNVDYNWVATLGSLQRVPAPRAEGDCAFAYLEEYNLEERGVETAQAVTGVEVSDVRRITVDDVENKTRVSKVGWSTQLTHGIVDGVGTYFLEYPAPVGRVGIEGFRVVPEKVGDNISEPGDSGSCWYLDPEDAEGADRTGAGLHFEGDPDSGPPFALACHLDASLECLEIALTKP